jgi:hypothetical protein
LDKTMYPVKTIPATSSRLRRRGQLSVADSA